MNTNANFACQLAMNAANHWLSVSHNELQSNLGKTLAKLLNGAAQLIDLLV